MYDWKMADKAQRAYCEEHNAPHFAPTRDCYNCGQNIYDDTGREKFGPLRRQVFTGNTRPGITVEKAGSELITGCPFCNASYCE